MTETVIGLLRHGQTDWNIDFRLQGITDIPLNQTGIAQAHSAAAKLRSEDWNFVASSPLVRALETAKIVASALAVSEVAIEPLLLERSFGDAEGLTHAEWKTQFPDGAPPGGESLDALRTRANELLNQLLSTYRGTKVLAVSHGAMIRKIVRVVSKGQLPIAGERFENTSLTVLVHDSDGWRISSYNPKSLS
ncbi:MAG: histidine phosphatase family protein [Micrococcales bacterium]